MQEADKSIRFYQNLKGNSGEYEILQSELKKLKETVGGDEKDKLNDNALNASRLASAVRKAFLIGIVLAALNQFCGCFAMLNYTASIFKEAGSSLTPNMSTIVIGIIQFLGSYFATILVDRTGRKVKPLSPFLLVILKLICFYLLFSMDNFRNCSFYSWHQQQELHWV